MKADNAMRWGFVLPLPVFVLHPLTAVVVAIVHVYLAIGHLSNLIGGDVQWTHIWKGFGALAGAYVFAALASCGLARQEGSVQKPLADQTPSIASSIQTVSNN